MTINDYGQPADRLNAPSLSAWSAAVATMLNRHETGDVWTTWVPTITGGTVSATTCRYRRTPGGLVTFVATLTIATVTGAFAFSAPPGVPALERVDCVARLVDFGVGFVTGTASIAANVDIWAPATAGGMVRALAPTVPFTWAAGDTISVLGDYRTNPL